jgi:hypothetical protein
MGFGHNYSIAHAAAVEYIRRCHRKLLRSLDRVAWTSDPTPWNGNPDAIYNCFGYVLDKRQWLEPPITIDGDDENEDDPRYKWIGKIKPSPHNQQVAVYISAAKGCDFVECGLDSSWEPQTEKIVLLADKSHKFQHAAWQAGPNLWRSKIGEHSDIEHPLKVIVGGAFGKNLIFMKRLRRHRVLP